MLSGIVLLNKPRGLSSNTAANVVRKACHAEKAGHLGTLDVAGEGLLPVTLGKATKLFDYYLKKDKTYVTKFQFGITTDTLDLEGEITEKNDKIILKEDVLQVIDKLVGKQAQMPPQYSAKKVNGKRAYDLARSGEVALLKPKEIEIFSIVLLSNPENNIFEFEVACSSGTYIRSLCRDMANLLSTCGVMQSILRTKCGDYYIKDAYTLERIKSGDYTFIKCEDIFNFPKITIDEAQTVKLLNGNAIKLEISDGEFNIYSDDYLGVVEVLDGYGKFKFRFV